MWNIYVSIMFLYLEANPSWILSILRWSRALIHWRSLKHDRFFLVRYSSLEHRFLFVFTRTRRRESCGGPAQFALVSCNVVNCIKVGYYLLILLMSVRCRLPYQAAKYFNDNNGVTSVRFLLERGPSSKAKIIRGCSRTQMRARFSARIHAHQCNACGWLVGA